MSVHFTESYSAAKGPFIHDTFEGEMSVFFPLKLVGVEFYIMIMAGECFCSLRVKPRGYFLF